MGRTRNERRERRNEILTVAGIVVFMAALVWLGFELRGALEVCAW